jgi:hypothetical protein
MVGTYNVSTDVFSVAGTRDLRGLGKKVRPLPTVPGDYACGVVDMSLIGVLVLVALFVGVVVVSFALGVIINALGVPGSVWVWPMFAVWFAGPIVLYWRYTKRQDRKRQRKARRAFQAATEAVSGEDLRHWLKPFPTFSGRVSNTTLGLFRTHVDGTEVSVFDYSFTSIPKILRWAPLLPLIPRGACLLFIRSRRQTVVLCRRQEIALPQFFLHRREAIAKEGIFSLDLGSEVLLPPEFSPGYLLRGPGPDRMCEIFTPEILSHYMQRGTLHTEAMGDTFLVYEPGRFLRPEQIASFVNETVFLFNLFTATARAAENGDQSRVFPGAGSE